MKTLFPLAFALAGLVMPPGASSPPSRSIDGMAKPDPQMQAVLDALASLHPKPIETLSAAEARKQPTPADAVNVVLKNHGKSTAPQPVGKVEDRTIPGPASALPVRLYWPSGHGPFPVLVYFHGGGWVIANKDVDDATPRAMVNMATCMVVSVDYRQGPEHKFPAAHDDAYAAYEWVMDNASSIDGDPNNVAVGGESAGGNLAVAVSMMARDRGQPMPKHQMVVYPVAGYDTTTPSYQDNANAKPLNKAMMAWFFDKYLHNPADGKDPRINLVAANLKGLPPATIITDQIDPLRSEGQMLAEKMKDAGVKVDSKTYDGVTHEFFGMGAVVDKAKEAEQQAADGLKSAFGKSAR